MKNSSPEYCSCNAVMHAKNLYKSCRWAEELKCNMGTGPCISGAFNDFAQPGMLLTFRICLCKLEPYQC